MYRRYIIYFYWHLTKYSLWEFYVWEDHMAKPPCFLSLWEHFLNPATYLFLNVSMFLAVFCPDDRVPNIIVLLFCSNLWGEVLRVVTARGTRYDGDIGTVTWSTALPESAGWRGVSHKAAGGVHHLRPRGVTSTIPRAHHQSRSLRQSHSLSIEISEICM